MNHMFERCVNLNSIMEVAYGLEDFDTIFEGCIGLDSRNIVRIGEKPRRMLSSPSVDTNSSSIKEPEVSDNSRLTSLF